MQGSIARLGLVCTLVLLAGCAGSPPVKYYTLAAATAGVKAIPDLAPVQVADVVLPEYLGRSPVVVRNDPVVVSFSDFQRWAAPLDGEIQRIISANLSAHFGSPVDSTEACLLYVMVDQFEPSMDGLVVLQVRWTLEGVNRVVIASESRAKRYTAQADAETYEASVAAMSRVLQELSDDIAAAYVVAQGGGPPAAGDATPDNN
jgi:uncharacterized lipoprotein YmbA